MPKKLFWSRHASLQQAALCALLALFVALGAPLNALAQTSFETGIATQAEALASDDTEARAAAITYLRTLPREALPAIQARLERARRARPTLEEANTVLTAFRRATGSRRADDLVDLADGVATVLSTTRDRATLKMAEPLLLLRSLEAMHTHEASMVMPQVFRLDGEAWRMESRRLTIRMGDDIAAAAIRARGDEDNAEGRAWARWSTERLGLDAPGTLVQRLSHAQLSEVLRAFGETHTLSAIPVVASFVDADHRRVREAAREGLRAYRQNGIWVARETFRTRLGEDANANWGWERTLNALFEGLDAARAEHVRGALGDALAATERSELADAQRLLDAALVRSPELADAEAARLYARLADGNYALNRETSRTLFQRAIMLAPTSVEAARWRAEVLHLDAQSDLARGILDADAFERAASEATCTRCVETYAQIAPQRALPEATHRPLALGAAALLFALLGLLMLPLWSRAVPAEKSPKTTRLSQGLRAEDTLA